MNKLTAAILICAALLVGSLTATTASGASATTATTRDGHKDFDFLFGLGAPIIVFFESG